MPGLAGSGGSLEGIGGELANGCDCCHGTPPECPSDCSGYPNSYCVIFRCDLEIVSSTYTRTGCAWAEDGDTGTIACLNGTWTLTSGRYSGVEWRGTSPTGPFTLHHSTALPCDDLALLSITDALEGRCDACTCSTCCQSITFSYSTSTVTLYSAGANCSYVFVSSTGIIDDASLSCLGNRWYVSLHFNDGTATHTSYAVATGTGCPPTASFTFWFDVVTNTNVIGVGCGDVTPPAGPCPTSDNCAECCTSYTVNFDNGGSATFGPPISAVCQWNGASQTSPIVLAISLVATTGDPCLHTMRVLVAGSFVDFEAMATEANGCPPTTGWTFVSASDGHTVFNVTSVTRTLCP